MTDLTNVYSHLSTRMSAHPKVDEYTGELVFIDFGLRAPYLRYGVVGPAGRVTHLVDIDVPGPRMFHDVAITEHYTILLDHPWLPDQEAARHGRHRLVFDRGLPARYGVIPRHGEAGDIHWFEAEPCYVYHTINAWEEGEAIVLDVCRMANPAPVSDSLSAQERAEAYLRLENANLYRYRFNLRTGRTHEERRDDADVEFPSWNTRYQGRRSRFAYTQRLARGRRTTPFDAVIKYDTEKGTSEHYAFGEGRWGSEASFAPRSGAVVEDEGYLVSFVHDEREGRSEVLVLNAQAIGAGPVELPSGLVETAADDPLRAGTKTA